MVLVPKRFGTKTFPYFVLSNDATYLKSKDEVRCCIISNHKHVSERWWQMCLESWRNDVKHRRQKKVGQNPATLQFHVLQILTWDWTQASTVKSQHPTTRTRLIRSSGNKQFLNFLADMDYIAKKCSQHFSIVVRVFIARLMLSLRSCLAMLGNTNTHTHITCICNRTRCFLLVGPEPICQ
jgi:hypothetical protein